MVNLSRMEGVAAIVLAAGRSERMGAFKPLLPFGNSTVIETCIEHLRRGGVETVLVVLGQGPHAEKLKEHLKNAGVTFAINPDPASEMSDSIACGVSRLAGQTKAGLITPADHPAVPAEVVAELIHEWQQGALLVVPTFNNRGGHPVLIDLSFRGELLNLDSRRGLKALFDAHPDRVRRLAVNSNYIARDMDTWDDYRVLHEEVFGVSPPGREPGDTK
ncbi:MAG: nucleotidyltransferase family protein [Pyrinomonadaceae bacterium]|nr:nucleotidyltransferase family protein [Pyrinomonadaceae bacterium]